MKKLREKTKDKIKLGIALGILLTIILTVLLIIVQYQVEGEKNMPYKLSKITIISTAEGEQNTVEGEEDIKWNLNIFQNNDVYIFIDKASEDATDLLESVTIQNINITEAPKKGTVKAYMPNSEDGRVFTYDENYVIKSHLTYNGGTSSDTKTLTIGNQGGSCAIRFSNTNIGTYKSNEDTEIKHDGELIQKIGVTEEEITFNVSFDIIITVNDIKYKANVTLNLPCKNLIEEKTSSIEITDTSSIVFKRIR